MFSGWPISWQTSAGLDFGCSILCLALLGLIGVWQNGWVSGQYGGTTKIKVNPTEVRQEMGHPVVPTKIDFSFGLAC